VADHERPQCIGDQYEQTPEPIPGSQTLTPPGARHTSTSSQTQYNRFRGGCRRAPYAAERTLTGGTGSAQTEQVPRRTATRAHKEGQQPSAGSHRARATQPPPHRARATQPPPQRSAGRSPGDSTVRHARGLEVEPTAAAGRWIAPDAAARGRTGPSRPPPGRIGTSALTPFPSPVSDVPIAGEGCRPRPGGGQNKSTVDSPCRSTGWRRP